MSKNQETISRIYGMEPMREGEYPMAYIVGSPAYCDDRAVTRIDFREDNCGDYSIGWFDVFTENGRLASVNVRYVAEINYKQSG